MKEEKLKKMKEEKLKEKMNDGDGEVTFMYEVEYISKRLSKR